MNQLNVMPAAGNGKMMRVCQPSYKPLVPLYVLNPAKKWRKLFRSNADEADALLSIACEPSPGNCPLHRSFHQHFFRT
jgi:hypothetical protein